MTVTYYELTGTDIIEGVNARAAEIFAPPPHMILTTDADPLANLGKWYDRTDGTIHDAPPPEPEPEAA